MFGHILTLFRVPFAIAFVVLLLAVSQSAGSVHAASLNVDQGDPACSDVTGTPYCTIGAAVTDANAGDTINVFPGTYAEQVDLNDMNTQGDITVITVDASGTSTPSTVTVSPPNGAAFLADGPFPGSITIDGFVVDSPDEDGILLVATGNVSIANVTANAVGDATDSDLTGDDGVDVTSTDGEVAVTDSTGNDNAGDYADGFDLKAYEGNVAVTNTTANNNTGALDNDGIDIYDTGGNATITGATANGNSDSGVAIDGIFGNAAISDSGAANNGGDGFYVLAGGNLAVTNVTANDNSDEGFEIDDAEDATFNGVTASGNESDGIDIEPVEVDVDNLTVVNSRLESGVDDGFELSGLDAAGTHAINANIICANGADGLDQEVGSAATVGAGGNWWGAASGPTHPSNPSGTGDAVVDSSNGGGGTVDFDPWIDTITGSAGSATVGQPTVVTFEFTGGSGAVALQQGPGDPNGPPPFTATTDNGAVTSSGLIVDGELEVTLTPDTVGEATVTVTGPCGLDETAGGNSIVLDVAAAPAGATPTPAPTPTATPAELPPTGGQPASGDGGIVVMALAVAALGLAGSGIALAAVRRRR